MDDSSRDLAAQRDSSVIVGKADDCAPATRFPHWAFLPTTHRRVTPPPLPPSSSRPAPATTCPDAAPGHVQRACHGELQVTGPEPSRPLVDTAAAEAHGSTDPIVPHP